MVAPKIKHFMWKLFHDKLLTKESLLRHHIGVDGVCLIYRNQSETLGHLIMDSNLAKAV